MRFGIVGSRRWPSPSAVVEVVNALPADAVVVSGGAQGPDTWAVDAARRRGLSVTVHLPDAPASRTRWAATEAFYARNQRIVDDADELIAFVASDRRGGTEDTIRRARRRGIPIRLVSNPGQP